MKNLDCLPGVFLLGLGAFASTILAQTPGTFTATGNMTTARIGHTAILLADGRVLITGGAGQDGPTASAEIYDPAAGTFMPTGDMTTPRQNHGATLLPDGRVLIFGSQGPDLNTAELYDPSSGTFRATGSLVNAAPVFSSAATMIRDGKVVIVGIAESFGEVALAQVYDPATETFTAGGLGVNHPVNVVALADGRFFIAGIPGNQLYDPASGAFTSTGTSIQYNRNESTATLLANGKVLLTGGDNGSDFFNSFFVFDSAEIFDPQAGRVTATGSLLQARYLHTATLLGDGSVLITGGYALSSASAEAYDPSSGTFSAAGQMTTTRISHTATLLKDGRVLLTGGLGAGELASAELFNPSVLVPAPVLLSLSGDGQGQGAIQHAGTIRIASPSDPAVAGEALTIYAHGLPNGSVIPPQVAIGGQTAEIISFGMTPGYPGLAYINVRVPSGVAPGSAVSVRLTYIGRTSNQVTIGLH